MIDRQPYIDALSRALPGGMWIACSLDPLRIRSQAFEEICVLFPTDGRHPNLSLASIALLIWFVVWVLRVAGVGI